MRWRQKQRKRETERKRGRTDCVLDQVEKTLGTKILHMKLHSLNHRSKSRKSTTSSHGFCLQKNKPESRSGTIEKSQLFPAPCNPNIVTSDLSPKHIIQGSHKRRKGKKRKKKKNTSDASRHILRVVVLMLPFRGVEGITKRRIVKSA